jgi:hypothetical protein
MHLGRPVEANGDRNGEISKNKPKQHIQSPYQARGLEEKLSLGL